MQSSTGEPETCAFAATGTSIVNIHTRRLNTIGLFMPLQLCERRATIQEHETKAIHEDGDIKKSSRMGSAYPDTRQTTKPSAGGGSLEALPLALVLWGLACIGCGSLDCRAIGSGVGGRSVGPVGPGVIGGTTHLEDVIDNR